VAKAADHPTPFTMTCENKCPNCKCKKQEEDQSTKAFREANENNPSRLEARIYDV